MLLPVARFLIAGTCSRISRARRSLNEPSRCASERAWKNRRNQPERPCDIPICTRLMLSDAAHECELPATASEHRGGLERRDHAGATLEDRRERGHVRVEPRLQPDLAREVAVVEADRDRSPDAEVDRAGHLCRHRADQGDREAEGIAPGERPVHAGEGSSRAPPPATPSDRRHQRDSWKARGRLHERFRSG